MTIDITSEANATLPSAGQVTLFINTDKNYRLYAKYPDGSVLPYSGSAADCGCSPDLAKAWMDALKCGLLGGLISPAEYQNIMDQGITIQSSSSTDADGNTTCILSVGSRIIPLAGFTVDDETVPLVAPGGTHQIVPTFDPPYVSNQGVTYVSSDPAKATVSSTGLIQAVATGTTNISVIPQADPSKTRVVVVTVSA